MPFYGLKGWLIFCQILRFLDFTKARTAFIISIKKL